MLICNSQIAVPTTLHAQIYNDLRSILPDAVLKGEKIPEGVEIQADKRLILEFVRVGIS